MDRLLKLFEAEKYYEELEFIDDTSSVCRDLFGNWRVWGGLYVRPGVRLVSNDTQAFLESPLLGFWAGLDVSLSDDGHCRVVPPFLWIE